MCDYVMFFKHLCCCFCITAVCLSEYVNIITTAAGVKDDRNKYLAMCKIQNSVFLGLGTISISHLGGITGLVCTAKRAPKYLVKRSPDTIV